MSLRFSFFFLLVLFSHSIGSAQSTSIPIEDLFDLVRNEYDGDSALVTTAYVEKRWRLPGNRGFDESIFFVKEILERAGFQEEGPDNTSKLTYRLEKREMSHPSWEPVDGSVSIIG